ACGTSVEDGWRESSRPELLPARAACASIGVGSLVILGQISRAGVPCFAVAGLYGAEMRAALDRTQQPQKELWQEAVAAARQRPSPITSVFAQSLNQAIDVSENRLAALEKRVPAPVWLLLGLLSLFNCLIFGASARRRF